MPAHSNDYDGLAGSSNFSGLGGLTGGGVGVLAGGAVPATLGAVPTCDCPIAAGSEPDAGSALSLGGMVEGAGVMGGGEAGKVGVMLAGGERVEK